MKEKKKKLDLDIAIIGGGFAGVYCGKALLKRLSKGSRTRIGLIADENYMVFQPMLPEVASASLSPRHVVNPIRHLCRGLEVYKASVEKIDIKNKQLTIRPGAFSPPILIRFKHLVFALGAKVDLSRVPGMPEHAFLMQNVGDAMKLRATVLARFEEANLVMDAERRRRLLTFVVVGGGYSGVETAGQILDLFQGINKYYSNVSAKDFQVYLVHSREHLLPTLSTSLGEYAKNKLEARGLKILLQQRVKALTSSQVILQSGEIIESNTCVSTVGTAPHPLTLQLIKDTGVDSLHGRIKTTPTMQVPGYDWLWAAGDCAAVPMKLEKDEEEYCPSTAQFAMRQGALLGKNLNAFLRAEPVKPFTFKGLGELAAIGHHTAVAEIAGMRFSGFIAWWMWRTIYLAKLPGLDRKLRVLIDWTLDLFFPRDINLLSPRYTKTLQQVHLEAGNVLFNPGEPAFSFYIVKEGRIDITDSNGDLIKSVGSGEFFGERALLTDQIWRFKATASEESTLVGLGSEEFKTLLESSTSMRQLLENSARQYRSLSEIQALLHTLPKSVLQSTAGDLMTRNIKQIHNDESLLKVSETLSSERHSYYPVCDAQSGQHCGVLAREQFYDYLQDNALTTEGTIAAITLSKLPHIRAELEAGKCLETMTRTGSNKLIVLDESNQLKGILTIRDILSAQT
ncbi:FAD-dependent oxidoreductase [Coraliomargarita algicola]|uniref:NADH:ubiquinone reductase (non-electrogenic) n=1 Tax=Coraliomargarita algicola TaxID=3092156 RepID=A0ABZ0RN37_9BACT|nr:FAD-dependent oxidoreductase [Coraliomargarita sp. J2-16]WPJ94369.1 FAD-dependent oxidoreductase [Coraliomargarita sp. J2-16]